MLKIFIFSIKIRLKFVLSHIYNVNLHYLIITIIMTKKISTQSRLIRRKLNKAFISGVGSVISVPGNYCRVHRRSANNDAQAIASDWNNVGSYISNAMSEYGK